MRDVDDEGEWRDQFASYQAIVEEKAGRTFEIFQPVKFTSQVVAGAIFHIKYCVGGDQFVHARVF